MFKQKVISKYKIVSVRLPKLSEVDHILHYADFDIPYTDGYIMGSRAKGTHNEGSDIDITLVVPSTWNPLEGLDSLNEDLLNVIGDMDGLSHNWDIQVWHENDPRLKDYTKIPMKH
jgi:predicted nucleotidyltransferase